MVIPRCRTVMAKQKPSKDKAQQSGIQVVCRNRKAKHEYQILETIEAGMALRGTEVKSLRSGKASIDDAFARIKNGEVWLVNADIPIYPQAGMMNHPPKRPRKLLLHRREIVKLASRLHERGLTLVPLRIYFKRGYAKVELALARGKRQYDKREILRKKEAEREIRRAEGRRR